MKSHKEIHGITSISCHIHVSHNIFHMLSHNIQIFMPILNQPAMIHVSLIPNLQISVHETK